MLIAFNMIGAWSSGWLAEGVKKISIKCNLFNKIVDYFYFYFSTYSTNYCFVVFNLNRNAMVEHGSSYFGIGVADFRY